MMWFNQLQQGAEGEPYLSYAPTNTQTRVTSSQTLIIPRPHAQQKDFSQNDYPTNQTHNNASLPYDDTPRYPRGKQSSTLQRQLERNIDNYNRFDEQNAHM